MTGALAEDPIKEHLGAVSVGILPDGYCVLDLDYAEDSNLCSGYEHRDDRVW